MITVFVGEERNGRMKFTSDRDCLSPQVIRFSERVFADLADLKTSVKALEARGFAICVDTEKYFYETTKGASQ